MSRIEDNRDPGYEPRSVVITYTVTIDATIADCDDEDDTVRDMRATLAHATRALPGCNEISIEVAGACHAYDDLLAACSLALDFVLFHADGKTSTETSLRAAIAKATKAKGGAR